MNHFWATAAIASAFFITACSDDNPTSANNNSISASGSLFVDEAQHLMVMSPYAQTGNRCELENNTLIWKTITRTPEPDSSIYDFIGDTLVLYDFYEGHADSYGDLYVGGTAGSIYGTWTNTGCNRNSQTGETKCYTNTRYTTRTYNFAPGKVSANVEYHFDLYVADEQARGYMKSYFMAELYGFLKSRSQLSDASYLCDNEDSDSKAASSIEKNGVQILNETKTNQTFKMGDKTYTVTVKKAETTLHYSGRTNRDVIVEVTDGIATCSEHTIYKTVEKDLCKTENLPYFQIYDDEDDNDNKIFYVSRYKNTNHEEFLICLNEIALPIINATAINALSKASTNNDNFEKREERRIRKISKYIEN